MRYGIDQQNEISPRTKEALRRCRMGEMVDAPTPQARSKVTPAQQRRCPKCGAEFKTGVVVPFYGGPAGARVECYNGHITARLPSHTNFDIPPMWERRPPGTWRLTKDQRRRIDYRLRMQKAQERRRT